MCGRENGGPAAAAAAAAAQYGTRNVLLLEFCWAPTNSRRRLNSLPLTKADGKANTHTSTHQLAAQDT